MKRKHTRAEDIELRHLRYFIVVAEELHFGRAAQRLGIAQPPLSQQIQRLEQLLGHALFERRPRVRLTVAGEALHDVATRAVSQVRQGIDGVRRVGAGEVGSLTIGFAASTLLTPFTASIRRYRDHHPDVTLRLRELSTAAQQAALLDGSIDVGFLRQPGTIVEGLHCEPILREPFLVVLPPRHPLSERRRVSLESLAEEPFVQFPRTVAPGLHDQVLAVCASAGFSPRIVQEAHEWLTIVGLVEAGLGVALVPASFQRLRWGQVSYRPLRANGALTTTALCWAHHHAHPIVAGFLDAVRSTFRPRS